MDSVNNFKYVFLDKDEWNFSHY